MAKDCHVNASLSFFLIFKKVLQHCINFLPIRRLQGLHTPQSRFLRTISLLLLLFKKKKNWFSCYLEKSELLLHIVEKKPLDQWEMKVACKRCMLKNKRKKGSCCIVINSISEWEQSQKHPQKAGEIPHAYKCFLGKTEHIKHERRETTHQKK